MVTKEFFTVKTVSETLALFFENWTPPRRAITIPTVESLGRVLATAPLSPVDLPEFTRSSMDGYAVRAADTFGASQSLPAYLTTIGTVRMGEAPDFEIQSGQAAEIHTGAMLPKGADAVVMVEKTQTIGSSEIEVLAPVARGENLVLVGEDARAGSEVLPAGHQIRPQDIGGLLALGILTVEVIDSPRIALLSSGDELVTPDQQPQFGQIRDLNSYALAALFRQYGAQTQVAGIARDNMDDFYPKARAALDSADMLVLTAGSSVSTRDLTVDVVNRLGTPGILQHGLAVKPGKPTIIAVCDGKPVIGLPGNPVSAMLVARQMILPVIQGWFGLHPAPLMTVKAVLTQNVASSTGREDTVPVKLVERDGEWVAEPIFGKSNLIFTLVNADGLFVIPLNSGGIKAGTVVEVVAF